MRKSASVFSRNYADGSKPGISTFLLHKIFISKTAKPSKNRWFCGQTRWCNALKESSFPFSQPENAVTEFTIKINYPIDHPCQKW
jgi:hypothetical protein